MKSLILEKDSVHKWYSILTMIYVGTDHRGYELKEKMAKKLTDWGYDYIDMSEKKVEGDDYADVAIRVAEKVAGGKDRGILICGSGGGVCITANKVTGVRAGLAFDEKQVRKMREDDNINLLCLSADWVSESRNMGLVKTFLETIFGSEERQIRRIKKIEKYESNQC